MFNIQFGGSNSAQIYLATIMIGKREESLYISPKDIESLRDLLIQLHLEPQLLKDLIGLCEESIMYQRDQSSEDLPPY